MRDCQLASGWFSRSDAQGNECHDHLALNCYSRHRPQLAVAPFSVEVIAFATTSAC